MRCAAGFCESDTALKQYDLIILFIYLFFSRFLSGNAAQHTASSSAGIFLCKTTKRKHMYIMTLVLQLQPLL